MRNTRKAVFQISYRLSDYYNSNHKSMKLWCGCRPLCSVAILGVLGGAFSGGFCCALACGQARACKTSLGWGKINTGRVLFCRHCVSSFVFKNSLYSWLCFIFSLLAPPAINSPKKTKAKFSPAPENFAQIHKHFLLGIKKRKEASVVVEPFGREKNYLNKSKKALGVKIFVLSYFFKTSRSLSPVTI